MHRIRVNGYRFHLLFIHTIIHVVQDNIDFKINGLTIGCRTKNKNRLTFLT